MSKSIKGLVNSYLSAPSKRNTWVWVYGDEYPDLWEHFGMSGQNSNDRIKIKLIDFEEEGVSK